MKKVIFTIFLLTLIISSCSKLENNDYSSLKENKEPYSLFKIEKGMLSFSNLKDFNALIRKMENMQDEELVDFVNHLNFKSMLLFVNEEDREKMGIHDNLLAALLNSDGCIQIGSFIYFVDQKNERVYRIEENKYVDHDKFLEKIRINSPIIKEFSVYDELNEDNSVTLSRRRSCGRNKRGPYYFTMSNGQRLKYKLVYQASLFYHSLLAKIKRVDLSWGGPINFGMATNYQPRNYSYYKKVRSRNKVYINFNYGGNGRKYVWRVSKKLKEYRLKVNFFAYNTQDMSNVGHVLEIRCGI